MLRPVGWRDFARLRRWRNDPLTRRMFLDRRYVGLLRHALWLARLGRVRHAFIAEDWDTLGDAPLGTVGFTLETMRDGLVVADMTVTVAPECRQAHLAAEIIRLGYRKAYLRGASVCRARIRPENTPSIRAFERAGFAWVPGPGAVDPASGLAWLEREC